MNAFCVECCYRQPIIGAENDGKQFHISELIAHSTTIANDGVSVESPSFRGEGNGKRESEMTGYKTSIASPQKHCC